MLRRHRGRWPVCAPVPVLTVLLSVLAPAPSALGHSGDGADGSIGIEIELVVPDPAAGGVVSLTLPMPWPDGSQPVMFALAPIAGAHPVAMRGAAVGRDDLRAAGGVVGGALHLVVVADGGERWVVEPMEEGAAGEGGSRRHRVRPAASATPGAGHRCGTVDGLHLPGDTEQNSTHGPGGTVGLRSTQVRVAELACDADVEFVAWCGSAQAAADWMSVLVAVADLAFVRDTGITHQIASMRMRTAEPDPYTSRDPATMLAEFRSQWTGSGPDSAAPRDLAVLFSGKQPLGMVVGQAATIGGVCTSNGFAFIAPAYAPDLATQADLLAHELGHLWGACHCSCSFPASTMNPFIIGALRFGFAAPAVCGASGGTSGATSAAAIIAHRDTRTCLHTAVMPPACAADFNRTGGVTVQDIYDFIQVWSARLTPGDFNADGAVTAQDLYDFLTAWSTGCS